MYTDTGYYSHKSRKKSTVRAIIANLISPSRQTVDTLIFYSGFFVIGCLAYFCSPFIYGSPSFNNLVYIAIAGFGVLFVFLLVWFVSNFSLPYGVLFSIIAIMTFSAAFVLVDIRVKSVATKFLPTPQWYGRITGQVVAATSTPSSRVRVLLRVYKWHSFNRQSYLSKKSCDGSAARDQVCYMPAQVQISLHKNEVVNPGQTITLSAKLYRPSGPVAPASYDFAFYAYFNGIGATGYALSKLVKVATPDHTTANYGLSNNKIDEWLSLFQIKINAMRAIIAKRWQQLLPQPQSGIALALTIGERGAVDRDTYTVMRDAGLAHILAISGLHMGIAAGGMFWLVRASLALYPALALRLRIDSLAAVVGILTAVAVLLLSGGSPATDRAFIMYSIMFGAILLNKKALTLRNVALALFIIIALRPEYVLYPGFQMSFAAVIALIVVANSSAFYVAKFRKKLTFVDSDGFDSLHSLTSKIAVYVLLLLLGIAITSLVAGLSTAVISVFHFHRLPGYGVLANIIAIPIITFVTMPALILALLLMPFAGDYWPIIMAGYSIDWLVNCARFIVDFSGSVLLFFPLRPIALFGAFICLLLLCTRQLLLQLVAVLLLFALLLPFTWRQVPVILVAQTGNTVAVRVKDNYWLSIDNKGDKGDKFTLSIWRSMYHISYLKASSKHPERLLKQIDCNEVYCRINASHKLVVTVIKSRSHGNKFNFGRRSWRADQKITIATWLRLCRNSDVIVNLSDNVAVNNCQAKIISARHIRNGGSLAIIYTNGRLLMDSAVRRNDRPWHL